MKRSAPAVALLVLALASPARSSADGADAADGRKRHWAVPDQAKLQLAGNIGFLSPGLGYAWLDRRLEADVFFGWVPEAFGGDIFSLTAKLTWMPWSIRASGWNLRPFSAGLQLTYTFGNQYFVLLPEHYPESYYSVPTALRGGIALGVAAGRPAFGLEELGAYAELVAVDAMLGFWFGNRHAIGLTDVFSLALGVRAAF